MYKGIVFDLDGTLIDSPLDFNFIRSELGIPPKHDILQFLERLPAEERAPKLERLIEIELNFAEDAIPFVGVAELLEDLRSREIKVGILTRNCRAVVELVSGQHDMQFDHVVTREDAPHKPDPAGLKIFMSNWNVSPTDLLFVGDYLFDIQCGQNAGVRTALFTNGSPFDQNWRPDYVVKDFREFWISVKT